MLIPRHGGRTRRTAAARDLPPAVGRRAPGTLPTSTRPSVRISGLRLNAADRSYIRCHLGIKLGQFWPEIERISVSVRNVDAPNGGKVQGCRAKVVLSGPSV